MSHFYFCTVKFELKEYIYKSLNDIRFLSPPKTIIKSLATTTEWPSLAHGFFPINYAYCIFLAAGDDIFLCPPLSEFVIKFIEFFIWSVVGDELLNFYFSSSVNSNSALI